ncbi:hypothetical protein ACIGCP_19715 [Cellulophaga baltica]|uniref:hypothetical protein n=1 Tax=Cellulophaga baltica TaxID=76594 RepID=UPI0037C77DCB
MIKTSLFLIGLFAFISAIGQNDSIQHSKNKNSILISYESLKLDFATASETGAGITYTRDFFTRGKHNFAFQTSASFIYVINTSNIYFFGAGALYRYDMSKRSSLSLSVSGNYVYNRLTFDRFELGDNGEFIEQKSGLHSFAPSIGLNYSYDFLKIKSTTFGVLLGTKVIGLDNGEYTKFLEASKLNISFGFYCKF